MLQSIDELLRTPAIYCPDMSASEWQSELDLMLARSLATGDFLAGRITPAEFEDLLAASGIADPFDLADQWENGNPWAGPTWVQ